MQSSATSLHCAHLDQLSEVNPSPVIDRLLEQGCRSHRVKNFISNHQVALSTVCLIASYALPRLIDPQGGQVKRAALQRFFTITLPDNLPVAALIMANFIPKLENLLEPRVALSAFVLTVGASLILDLSRKVVACGVDKIDHPEAKKFAEFIGPRDFYARQEKQSEGGR